MLCSGGAIVYLIDCSFGLSFASNYDRKGSTLQHSIDSACYGRHSTRGTFRALQNLVLSSSCSCAGPSVGLEALLNLDSDIVVVDYLTPAIWGSSYGSEQLFPCRWLQKTFMWNSRKEYGRSEETITLSDGLNKLALLKTHRYRQGLLAAPISQLCPFMGAGREWIKLSPFISELCSVLRHRPSTEPSRALLRTPSKVLVPSSLLLGTRIW